MKSEQAANIEELRTLINRKRGFESIRHASAESGVDVTTLARFLNGTTNALRVETCLRLATWLRLSRGLVLRMAGHADIADALMLDDVLPPRSSVEEQLARELQDLNESERQALLKVVRANAAILRENRAFYDVQNNGGHIIGGR